MKQIIKAVKEIFFDKKSVFDNNDRLFFIFHGGILLFSLLAAMYFITMAFFAVFLYIKFEL